MSALYRQARPVTFDEVVGQDHVKDVLVSAVRRGRVGHAYLFSGPRGVGKTTTARLMAMAVNCDAPLEQRPCGKCESCRLVQAGAHPDVMELDAASNNSVEDVRDLRERTMLASMRGGTRVWILDEAHMLSKAAANALLKTLEEPPPGLMFVLATTEPERLPPTVLSRCQHFRFRRLTDAELVGKLARLTNAAGVPAETAALELVARSADGGMRDAESLLERLITGGEPITERRAEEALGLPPHERMRAMAVALGAGDLSGLLEQAAILYRAGFAPRTLAEQLARTLRAALHARLGGEGWLELGEDDLLRLLHALDDEQERFVRHDDLYALEVALIKARNALAGNVPEAFAARGAAAAAAGGAPGEVLLPAAATAPEPAGPARSVGGAGARSGSGRRPPDGAAAPRAPGAETPAAAATATAAPEVASADGAPEAPGEKPPSFSWHAVRSRADVRLKAFLIPPRVEHDAHTIRVVYPDGYEFHQRQLLMRLEEFGALVAEVAGPGFALVIDGPAGTTHVGADAGGGPKKA